MRELTPYDIFISILSKNKPAAEAMIQGNSNYPNIFGMIHFYDTPFGGVLVSAEIYGLPDNRMNGNSMTDNSMNGNSTTANQMPKSMIIKNSISSGFYGFHIHEFGDCTPPFNKTGDHYNPDKQPHPYHAGDMPPLLSNDGYACMIFYDKRLTIDDIVGKSVVIHSMRDDFTSQPSGDAGEKIACGVTHFLKSTAGIQN